MKTIQILIIVLSTLTLTSSCQQDMLNTDYQPESDNLDSNPNHPMKDSLQFLINKYISDGIPGAQEIGRAHV